MTEIQILSVYCGLILLVSWLGGWIPMHVRLTHTRLQVATSFVAGLMLGVGLLHLLPHAWHQSKSIDHSVQWALIGFMFMFFVQRFFHFHHHDVAEESPEAGTAGVGGRTASHAHHHDHHAHAHETCGHQQSLAEKSARRLSWAGAAVGLSMHTLTDGVALAASVNVEAGPHGAVFLAGLGTFLVIILHKPFDAMAIGTLMASGGWSRGARHLVNIAFALVIPLGVVLFHLGAAQYSHAASEFLGAALAFAAGSFLCIAASDLLPELQFHAHDRFKLSIALLAGLLLSVLVIHLESHGHDHSPSSHPGHTHGDGSSHSDH